MNVANDGIIAEWRHGFVHPMNKIEKNFQPGFPPEFSHTRQRLTKA
jgi:hypothetical protein